MRDLSDLIRPELVSIHPEAETAPDVIRNLAALLVRGGFAKPTLADAAIARELDFPTGLLLGDGDANAAIPHADREHVIAPAAAMAILAAPVGFHQMDEPETEIPVRLVVLLALPDADSQLSTLRALGGLLQDADLIRRMLAAENVDALLATLPKIGRSS